MHITLFLASSPYSIHLFWTKVPSSLDLSAIVRPKVLSKSAACERHSQPHFGCQAISIDTACSKTTSCVDNVTPSLSLTRSPNREVQTDIKVVPWIRTSPPGVTCHFTDGNLISILYYGGSLLQNRVTGANESENRLKKGRRDSPMSHWFSFGIQCVVQCVCVCVCVCVEKWSQGRSVKCVSGDEG